MPTDYLPTYRHSDFSAFDACPFNYACSLQQRVSKEADGDGDLKGRLLAYCNEQGADWIIQHAGAVAPVSTNYVTDRGNRFHEFAAAYGHYLATTCKGEDWVKAEEIARGLVGHDTKTLAIMRHWWEQWTWTPADPEAGDWIELRAGSFERGQEFTLDAAGRKVRFVWHPDVARLSSNGEVLEVWDWKSGASTSRFSPEYVPDQLMRYALLFKLLIPTLKESRLALWFVNPDNPLSDSPLNWTVDLSEPQSNGILVNPVCAIRAMTEFRERPGCWLCPFCEWVLHCPASDNIQVMDLEPEDAQQALDLIDDCDGLSGILNAKRTVLRKMLKQTAQKSGGRIDLEGGKWYGARRKRTVTIPDVLAFIAEGHQLSRDVDRFITVTDGPALASYLGMDDPFAEDKPMTTVALSWGEEWGVHMDGEAALTPREVKQRLAEIARTQATHVPVSEPRPEVLPPDYDEDMLGAF